jgi:succinate dehydrogenase flavin-adding protein (antitoxin of CptAB toxin-antitoxin module)
VAELDLLKALRVNAFHAVKHRDSDYVLRFVQRWYSRTFATPLDDVYDVPVEDLLMHFFEARYEEMEDDDLDHELMLLTETDAERTARLAKEAEEAADDDEFFEEQKAKAKKENKKIEFDPNAEPVIPVKTLGSNQETTFSEPETKSLLPDGFEASFMTADELGEMDPWDVLGDPKKDREKPLGK